MTITGLNHIDGNWVPAASGAVFERRNPADETDLIGTFPDSDAIDVRMPAVAGARVARHGAVVEASQV